MNLIVTDLQQDKALDTAAMLSVKGGFAGLLGGYWPAPSYAPAYYGGTNVISQNLTNINTQLNIAVGSANVFQNNSNTVFQA